MERLVGGKKNKETSSNLNCLILGFVAKENSYMLYLRPRFRILQYRDSRAPVLEEVACRERQVVAVSKKKGAAKT